jgi:hypothetical protein
LHLLLIHPTLPGLASFGFHLTEANPHMQTTLSLLAKDGAVYMAFSPALNSRQYDELWQYSPLKPMAAGRTA